MQDKENLGNGWQELSLVLVSNKHELLGNNHLLAKKVEKYSVNTRKLVSLVINEMPIVCKRKDVNSLFK